MSDSHKNKSGSLTVLAGVLMTLVLAAWVIFGVHRASVPSSPYPKIDPVKVKRLIDEGKISGKKADYFEEIVQ